MIIEVARWEICGQSELEEEIAFMTDGEILSSDGHFALDLIADRNEYIYFQLPGVYPLTPIEAIWPTREYYLYYNLHPHSGIRTEIVSHVSKDGLGFIPHYKSKGKPVSQEPWSEVIIFRLA